MKTYNIDFVNGIVTLYPYFVMLVNSFKSLNEIFAILAKRKH